MDRIWILYEQVFKYETWDGNSESFRIYLKGP